MPPLPNPRSGLRDSMSTSRPGIVFTSVRPVDPASSAIVAIRTMSVTAGESFTNNGSVVSARALVTTSRSASGSWPNSIPPARTFGQLTFSSKPSIPSTPSSRATTSAKCSTAADDVDQDSRSRHALSEPRQVLVRTASTPGFARPIALSIPAANSATRGDGAP